MNKTVLFFLILINFGYACDALPDYMIIENDTLEFRKTYIPIKQLFRPFSRYKRKLMRQGGSSTACYIYREMWKIENDSLYLDTLLACNSRVYLLDNESIEKLQSAGIPDSTVNKIKAISGIVYRSFWELNDNFKDALTREELNFTERYIYRSTSQIPAQRIPLVYDTLLKKRYRNRKIFAEFYSGLFSVEVGEIVDSMLVHWHNVSNREIFFQINEGIVEDTFSAAASINDSISVVNSINMKNFILPIFPSWSHQDSIATDTITSIHFQDTLNSTMILYKSVNVESNFDKHSLFSEVRQIIDNFVTVNSSEYSFGDYSYLKLLYKGAVRSEWQIPYLNFVTGIELDNSNFKRICVLFTYNKRVIIEIESETQAELEDVFDNLISNIDCEWIQREQ